MPNDGGADSAKSANEDEYIAQLLAKDARECSVRYSALGKYGAAPERPAGRVPKPNTRFLKNILRETDTHNANLKRKEEQEARERMRRLRQERSPPSTGSRNNKHGGDRELKRRRVESSRERDRERSDRRKSRRSSDGDDTRDLEAGSNTDKSRDKERHSIRREKEVSKRTSHREDERSDDGLHHREKRRRRRRDDSRRRSPDRDRDRDRDGRHGKKERHQRRSHSPRKRRRSRSEDRSRRRHGERESTTEHKGDRRGIPSSKESGQTTPEEANKSAQTSEKPVSESDDDPLNDIIGPLPPSATSHNQPSRPRGRGAYKTNASNIEAHFAEGYDPTLDVHPDDDEDTNIGSRKRSSNVRPVAGLTADHDDIDDDWDMALEALRDRALWKRKGAERLREAGFEENVVERWANHKAFAGLHGNNGTVDGQDRDVADVQWAKKGEGREWDRGKVVDEDGHVGIKPPW